MVNKLKTGLAGLALVLATATPGMAQSESQVGANVRFPIGKDFFKGMQIGVQGQYAKIQENAVWGSEAGVFIAPFSGSYKPSVEAKLIGGNEETLGKAGIGYDFALNDGFTSLGVQYENAEAVVNFLKENGTKMYFGANTFGGFDKYEKSTPVGSVVAPVVEVPTGPIIGEDN